MWPRATRNLNVFARVEIIFDWRCGLRVFHRKRRRNRRIIKRLYPEFYCRKWPQSVPNNKCIKWAAYKKVCVRSWGKPQDEGLAGVRASTEDGRWWKNVFNELRMVSIDHNHTFVLYVSCQSRGNFVFLRRRDLISVNVAVFRLEKTVCFYLGKSIL